MTVQDVGGSDTVGSVTMGGSDLWVSDRVVFTWVVMMGGSDMEVVTWGGGICNKVALRMLYSTGCMMDP